MVLGPESNGPANARKMLRNLLLGVAGSVNVPSEDCDEVSDDGAAQWTHRNNAETSGRL